MPRGVAIFCEDNGHEQFLRALLARLSESEGVAVEPRFVSARGGHGRAIKELKAWQKLVARGVVVGRPDLLVVMIDGNCKGWNAKRREIEEALDAGLFPSVVIGVPDPHVERWCIADGAAWLAVVGAAAPADPGKCERDLYKKLLADALAAAGVTVITDEMELAPDLVSRMNLHAAGKAQAALGTFIRELREVFRAWKAAPKA